MAQAILSTGSQVQTPAVRPEEKADQKPLTREELVFKTQGISKVLAEFWPREKNSAAASKLFREKTADAMREEAHKFALDQPARIADDERVVATAISQAHALKGVEKAADDLSPLSYEPASSPPGNDPLKELRAFAAEAFDADGLYGHVNNLSYDRRYNLSQEERDFIASALERTLRNSQSREASRPELLRLYRCLIDLRDPVAIVGVEAVGTVRRETLMTIHGVLKNYVLQENLAHRFKQVFGEKRDPKEMAGLFKALHQNQRNVAAYLPATLESFQMTTIRHQESAGSFSHARFLEMEEVILNAEEARYKNLHEFAQHITRAVSWSGPEGQIAVQDADLNSIEGILRFFNNPDHQRFFDDISRLDSTDLRLDEDVTHCLCKMRNLTYLENRACAEKPDSSLTHLPNELRALTNLQMLVLEGHSFERIPEVVNELPNLLYLSLHGNKKPISEVPAAFTRSYLGGWASLALEPVREFAGLLHCVLPSVGEELDINLEAISLYHTAGLPYENLERIPFSLWFRDHFSIPYFPTVIAATLEAAVIGLFFGVNWVLHLFQPRNGPDLLICIADSVNFGVGVFATALLFISTVVLNLPIFVLNVIINRVIEPIVSWVRESCCGCDPMVEL